VLERERRVVVVGERIALGAAAAGDEHDGGESSQGGEGAAHGSRIRSVDGTGP
jgi:hypothetical protein